MRARADFIWIGYEPSNIAVAVIRGRREFFIMVRVQSRTAGGVLSVHEVVDVAVRCCLLSVGEPDLVES